MKQGILLMAVALLGFGTTSAQEMNAVLMKTFAAFDSTRELEPKLAKANKLELIAKKWKDEWAPHYYNAYAKAQMSFMMGQTADDMSKRDAVLDEADAELQEAVSLLGEETSEIYVLKAMLAQARMAVDGRNRWMEYGKKFEENLKLAKEKDENNPRIYYMKGTGTFFTPKAFGGGAKNALPYFEKAKPMFEAEKKGDMNDPFWGSEANEYFISMANKQLNGEDEETETADEEIEESSDEG